jgi:hypothetical protein
MPYEDNVWFLTIPLLIASLMDWVVTIHAGDFYSYAIYLRISSKFELRICKANKIHTAFRSKIAAEESRKQFRKRILRTLA